MQYKVIYQNGPDIEKVLFSSFVERYCWDYVRARLEHGSEQVRDTAMLYVVKNSFDEFVDFPVDIVALRNYNKINTKKCA